MDEKPKYLVRPTDFHIFELDESNGCYRSWTTRDVTRSDGTRPDAQLHFTLENLTENYKFFPIEADCLSWYTKKNEEYCEFMSWHSRSDGHGGCKGGTYEEFLRKYKKHLEI